MNKGNPSTPGCSLVLSHCFQDSLEDPWTVPLKEDGLSTTGTLLSSTVFGRFTAVVSLCIFKMTAVCPTKHFAGDLLASLAYQHCGGVGENARGAESQPYTSENIKMAQD